jgi:hypothetical protein
MLQIRRLLPATLIVWVGVVIASPALGQDVGINGRLVPVPPEVVSRDSEGQVTIRAVRLTEALVIDGLLRDPIYSQVPAISDFVQQEPHEGEPATESTELWIFFDDKNLYVSARCLDSEPGRTIANELRRDGDSLNRNDNVHLVIDTFYDRRSAFAFQTNALGALGDQEVSDERTTNPDWNTVWDVKSATTDQGWSVEIVIPFKSLRYRASGAQTWGFNFQRTVRWKNERSYLSGVPASYGGRGINKLSSAATLVGLEVPPQGRNLEIKPYAISELATNRHVHPPVVNDLTADAGFDVKYGLTKGLTADFTYNTDFAQVEEDEEQVNLTRFDLFFPEKRDFFLEGQGLFAFGPAGEARFTAGNAPILLPVVFFSRRIGLSGEHQVPILVGGRVTGRVGRQALGVLNIQTKESEAAGAEATNFSVLRVRRDILRRSAVGFIATHRSVSETGHHENQVVGVDTSLAFFENVTINSYYARTRTPGRRGDDASYLAQFAYEADRYGLNAEHLSVGDAFNPEIGFLRRESFRRTYLQSRFSPRLRSSESVRKVSGEGSFDYITDAPARELQAKEVSALFRIDFQSSDQLSFEHSREYELLPARFQISPGVFVPAGGYDYHLTRATYNLGQQRPVSGRLTTAGGTLYDGTRWEAGYNGRWGITPRFSLEPTVSLNWVHLPYGDFTAHLAGTRVTVTPSARMVISSLVQWNAGASSLTSSARLRWEYTGGSELFVVYSDGRDAGISGFPGLLNRTLAVKVTRLFRF